MNEDLAEVKLDFEIYFTNREIDILHGRVDKHSLSLFAWDDHDLNVLASPFLSGSVPFPAAAGLAQCVRPLPPHKPIYPGDERWEPLGFEYLRYLQQKRMDVTVFAALKAGCDAAGETLQEEESQETDTEGQRLPLEESTLPSETKGKKKKKRQQGGAYWNGQLKALHASPLTTKAITPQTAKERDILAAALAEAQTIGKSKEKSSQPQRGSSAVQSRQRM
jgi:hypothetical protein